MSFVISTLLILLAVLLNGCSVFLTDVESHRPNTHEAKIIDNANTKISELLKSCTSGVYKSTTADSEPINNSIEDYKDYTIGYVEYTDQGWEYNKGAQRLALIKRMREDLNIPGAEKQMIVNVVFVHGWHHSAQDDDCNVNEFRAMMLQLNQDFAENSKPSKYRFNGIYVSWRGESAKYPILRQISVLDRRVAAEHVAKGSVRQLFADLRHLDVDDEENHPPRNHAERRLRTVVIGHSFGGLIAFHSLSPALINDLSLARPLDVNSIKTDSNGNYMCGKAAMERRFWPDMTLLINPAFEASRFEAVHDIASKARVCKDESPLPKMVVITAKNDTATGRYFPFFRTISSMFEQYDSTPPDATDLERDANIHAIGFVNRFKTHSLSLEKVGDNSSCIREKYEVPTNESTSTISESPQKSVQASKHVWVVGVPPEIVDGHSGFLYPDIKNNVYTPYLLQWIVYLYLQNSPDQIAQNVLLKYRSKLCDGDKKSITATVGIK
jgi:hypothetical protein